MCFEKCCKIVFYIFDFLVKQKHEENLVKNPCLDLKKKSYLIFRHSSLTQIKTSKSNSNIWRRHTLASTFKLQRTVIRTVGVKMWNGGLNVTRSYRTTGENDFVHRKWRTTWKKTRQMGREERWGHCTGFKLVSQLKVEEGKVPLLQLETKTYFEF